MDKFLFWHLTLSTIYTIVQFTVNIISCVSFYWKDYKQIGVFVFQPLHMQPWLACPDTQFIGLWFEAFVSHYKKVLVSLCNKNVFVYLCKSPVLCTCFFKKRPSVPFHFRCLASIFMRLIFTSLPVSQLGYPSTLFIPIAATIRT